MVNAGGTGRVGVGIAAGGGVGRVKHGGTGRPRLAISARLAPLPPSKSRISALPSALPSPNVNTHLPDVSRSADLLVTALPAGLVEGLALLFFSALRAEPAGVAFGRAETEGFDFAAVFLVFATALAMTANNPRERGSCAPYTTLAGSAQAPSPDWKARREAISAARVQSGRCKSDRSRPPDSAASA